MPRFVICYDLRKPDHDYQPLYDKLNSIKAKRIQDSVWVVRSTNDSRDIYKLLWPLMHNEKDRLLVAELDNTNWISNNGMSKISDV